MTNPDGLWNVPFEWGDDDPTPEPSPVAAVVNGNGHRAGNGHGRVTAVRDRPAEPEGLDVGGLRGQLLDVDAVCALPPPEPLIGEVLVRDSVAVLYGKPGCGKSFLALDWALCVATGAPWQGREVRGGRVLYIAAEGLRGLGRRLQAWRQAFHGGPWPPELAVYPRPLNVLDDRERAALVTLAGEDGYALVVIDTLNRSLVGGDENSSRDMGIAVDTAVQVQHAAGATVLFLHHEGRNDNIRGHSSLDGGVDTMIKATGDPDGHMTLTADKQKDAELFAPIQLHRDVITLGDGSTSCVLRAPAHTEDPGAATPTEQRLLGILRDSFPGIGARAGEWRAAAEMAESTFYNARGALLRKGLVVQATDHGHPRYQLPGPAAPAPTTPSPSEDPYARRP